MLHKHEIAIPLKGKDGSDHGDVVRCAVLEMAECFGGSRQHNETGYRFSPENELEVTYVAILTSHAKTCRANRSALRRIARKVLEHTGQSAVMIADGKGAELVSK